MLGVNNFRVMHVHLRNKESGDYYLDGKGWIPQIQVAQDFKSSSRALAAARKLPKEKVEIVVCFEDRSFDFSIPVEETAYSTPSPDSGMDPER